MAKIEEKKTAKAAATKKAAPTKAAPKKTAARKAAPKKAAAPRKSAAKKTNGSPVSVSHDDIAARAYEIWQSEGQPPHRDQEFWLKAEQQLQSERSA